MIHLIKNRAGCLGLLKSLILGFNSYCGETKPGLWDLSRANCPKCIKLMSKQEKGE